MSLIQGEAVRGENVRNAAKRGSYGTSQLVESEFRSGARFESVPVILGLEITLRRDIENPSGRPLFDERLKIDGPFTGGGASQQEIGTQHRIPDPSFHREFEMTWIRNAGVESGPVEQEDLQRTIGAVEKKWFGQDIASRSGEIGDHRPLATEQGVEETGFAAFGRPTRTTITKSSVDRINEPDDPKRPRSANRGDQITCNRDHVLLVGKWRLDQPATYEFVGDLRAKAPSPHSMATGGLSVTFQPGWSRRSPRPEEDRSVRSGRHVRCIHPVRHHAGACRAVRLVDRVRSGSDR